MLNKCRHIKVLGLRHSKSQLASAFSGFSIDCRTRRGALRIPGFVHFAFILMLCALLGGCLSRSRPVSLRLSTAPLLTATSSDLVERVNDQVSKIHTVRATMKLTASVGGSKRGKISEYQEIQGYLLARKPSFLRMIGLFPILQNRMFDMASDADSFKVWLPSKNQFIVGINQESRPSNSPLGSLRPQVILDALLLQAISQSEGPAVLEEGNHTVLDSASRRPLLQPDYTLNIVRRNGHGWYLARKISFDRTDLKPYREVDYDENGSVVTDTHYEGYATSDGCTFPTKVEIWRPQEEYSIRLKIVKLSLNESIPDGQFRLEPPPGARVVSR